MDRYQYLLVMAACLVLTLPLELVLGARVWRRPRRLLRALVPPAVVFSAWDVAAIAHHHWRYSSHYVTGWDLPGQLPVEEVIFFLVVPLCSLLTFEVVGRIVAGRGRARSLRRLFLPVGRPGSIDDGCGAQPCGER